jgi:hypothetical protein
VKTVVRALIAAAAALAPAASAQTPAHPPGQSLGEAVTAYKAWAQAAAPLAPRYVAVPGMTAAGHPTTVILDSATGRAWLLTVTDANASPALVPLAYVKPPAVVPPGLTLTPTE